MKNESVQSSASPEAVNPLAAIQLEVEKANRAPKRVGLLSIKSAESLSKAFDKDSADDVRFMESSAGMEAITTLHCEGIREYLCR